MEILRRQAERGRIEVVKRVSAEVDSNVVSALPHAVLSQYLNRLTNVAVTFTETQCSFTGTMDNVSKAEQELQKLVQNHISSHYPELSSLSVFGDKAASKTGFDDAASNLDRVISDMSGVSLATPFECQIHKVKVVVKTGDLTTEPVDAIVNAANKKLLHGAGVARAIANAGGPGFDEKSREIVIRHGKLKVAAVRVQTATGRLRCKHVIHTVGPHLFQYRGLQADCFNDLVKTFVEVMREADKMKLQSVAFPAISAGVFMVPQLAVAHAFGKAVRTHSRLVNHLKFIQFVDIDTEMVELVAKCVQVEDDDIPSLVELFKPPPTRTFGFFSNIMETEDLDNPMVIGNDLVDDVAMDVDDFDIKQTVRPKNNRKEEKKQDYKSTAGNDASSSVSSNNGKKKKKKQANRELPAENLDNAKEPVNITSHDTIVASTEPKGNVPSLKLNTAIRPPLTTSQKSVRTPIAEVCPICINYKVEPQILPSCEHSGCRTCITGSIEKNNKCPVCGKAAAVSDLQNLDSERCPICFCDITNARVLDICKHVFCAECIEHALEVNHKCPICGILYGEPKGNMPQGTMNVSHTEWGVKGYDNVGTIVINYHFPDGKQTEEHPHPGKTYYGTSRTAYLPNNPEGNKVLALLKRAWDARLTFTVGRSATTGLDDQVVWNDIHHKTSPSGGAFGYPDATYLNRVQEELAAKGIK